MALVSTRSSRFSAATGTETHWRVIARRSFMPAAPISRKDTSRVLARCLISASAAMSRFSIHRYRWSPWPLGSYAGTSSTTKSSGSRLIVASIDGASALSRGR